MNHRRRPRGYHSLAALCMAGLAAAYPSSALGSAATHPSAVASDPWWEARALVVSYINAARAAHGVPSLLPMPLLSRVGDQHCWDLLEDRVLGHFSRRGTPPYLRYLLAGGTGYHRQNVGALVSSTPHCPDTVPAVLLELAQRMLAERPPDDGHRATLLDPTSTHIGIGIAVRDGWLACTHEVAVVLAEEVSLPPPVALPGAQLRYAASLPAPWQVQAVELLWEPLPNPLSAAQANAIAAYRYPSRRAITFKGRRGPGVAVEGHPGGTRFELVEAWGGRFSYRWLARPEPGVEILVVWASRGSRLQPLVAVAAAAVVVTEDGTLPPELGRWVELRGVGRPTPG